MPEGEPTVRDATLEDAPAILGLIQAAYDRWPPYEVGVTPLEHLRWKMSPPRSTLPHHTLVFIGDRPAATQLRWMSRVQVDEREYEADDGADLAVHPDFRGRGLARLIKDRDHQRLIGGGFAGMWTRSNAPQVRHMYDPDLVTRRLVTWARPFRRRSYASLHFREGGIRQLARAAQSRLLPSRHAGGVRPDIRVLERFDDRTDEVWTAARGAYDFIPFHDAQYLNWRFRAPSVGQPTILGALEGERVVAYCVLRRTGDQGEILDWLWRPEHEQAVPPLLDAAIEQLKDLGARNAAMWLSAGHRAEALVARAGFGRVGEQIVQFGSREAGLTPPELLDVIEDPTRTMHLTMSNFDYV